MTRRRTKRSSASFSTGRALAAALLPLSLAGCASAGLDAGTTSVGSEQGNAASGEWRAIDAQTGQIQDIGELEQLARDFPSSASVRLRLLSAHIQADDRGAARNSLEWLLEREYGFSDAGQATLAAFFEDPVLANRLARPPATIARSTLAITIPAGARLIEGLAMLPDGRGYAATSIVDRALYLSDDGQSWTRQDIDGAGSLSGIVSDPERGLLWISSGVFDPTPSPETAFRGIIGFDLDTRQVIRRIAAPARATVSDLYLARDGALFASDPLSGIVYTAEPDADRLQVFVGGQLRSPQGIVQAADSGALIVSDYRYGLARIDRRTRAIERIGTRLPLALDGIDAMVLHGDELIVLQNGIAPNRILALRLDRRARDVIDYRIIELGHPEWTEILGATIVGNRLHYIANGQWNRFGPAGVASVDTPPLATQIRAVILDAPGS